MSDLEGEKLDLQYPCQWEYRVIGADSEEVMAAITSIMADRPHCCAPGHTSEGGRWCTLVVSLEVADEAERVGLYEALRDNEAVKMVL
ncbi:MAG: DUF493 domain-containing protein [Planctomycetota bacterium]|nr:DUF493 domain-containing protein [Planctomycetota bacterium]